MDLVGLPRRRWHRPRAGHRRLVGARGGAKASPEEANSRGAKPEFTHLASIIMSLGHDVSARGIEDLFEHKPFRVELVTGDEMGRSRYTMVITKRPTREEVH